MKLFSGIIVFFIAFSLSAQTGRLTLHGRVKNGARIVNDATIEVYKNNELFIETKNQRNGSFKLDLTLGKIYSVTFKKKGYIDKSVAVIAKSDSTIRGRYFFQLDIELYRLDQEGQDESVLPPAAKLYIKTKDGGFKYDKKYVRWVANAFEEIDD